jgi:hypothetical protein
MVFLTQSGRSKQMKTNLFIPKTITVGYVTRDDTFTKKLAYIIYTDAKGVLRKEKSWQNWRDQTIDPNIFDNEPSTDFTFNKGVRRYSDWQGSGRSMIRVWDPRGFEFEITLENLEGLLMHSDVSKRSILQPCVYAWAGTELVLLPTNSQEYEQSVSHTDKQDMKVSTKELGVGYTYELKKDATQVVYLGRFDTYGIKYNEGNKYAAQSLTSEKKKPQHVFYDIARSTIEFKSPSAYVARVLSEECHPEYAIFMDRFYSEYTSQPLIGVTVHVPLQTVDDHFYDMHEVYQTNDQYTPHYLAQNVTESLRNCYKEIAPNQFAKIDIDLDLYDYYGNSPTKVTVEYDSAAVFYPEENVLKRSEQTTNQRYYHQPVIYGEKNALPEINKSTPAVLEFMRAIEADLNVAIIGWDKRKHGDENGVDDALRTILQKIIDVTLKHKFGKLHGILANGQVAKNELF